MTTQTPVTQALDAAGIDYRLFLHTRPVRSLEQAAQERDLQPEQIVRSLLFRLEGPLYVMALIPGPSQVDWPKLRHFLGVSRVTMADAEEVLQVTGYVPGAVSPFGLAHELRLLADPCLKSLDTISLGAGIRDAGIIMQRSDLERILPLEWVDLRADDCPPAKIMP